MKIVTIIGARPQFIKAAPVSRAMRATGELQEVIVHTGQHFDTNMSQVFFDQMQIPRPDYQLGIHSMGHGAMTGRMMEGIEQVLLKEKPDWVMVFGDTNSTLAGALAAVKMQLPVAHVEAGLRSFNMRMPEEVNRILTDRISSLLFCPTLLSMENLIKEGFGHFNCKIITTGDVMYDAALLFAGSATPPEGLALPVRFILATIHREENTNNLSRLRDILEAINEIATSVPVIFPMHPRTRKLSHDHGLPAPGPGVRVVDPLGYHQILYLLQYCQLVITDSGGMQKEAYFFQKPCVTLREETEWGELMEAGCNLLTGSSKLRIREAVTRFLDQAPEFPPGLYGKGNASEAIAEAFLET